MKKTLLLSFALLLTLGLPAKDYRYSVEKIWDNDMYCAFTSIEKFHGWYYVAFREARGHVFDENGKAEGKIRVIRSKNLKKWESMALIGMPDMDFRDPKLSITPDGKLLVSIGVSTYVNGELVSEDPWVAYSTDGKEFVVEKCVLADDHVNDWPWHLTWNGDTGYNVDYYWENGKRGLSLLKTNDGIHYTTHCELPIPDGPNEATIRFREDGQMAILIRRGGGNGNGCWAVSNPPYTDWSWKEIPLWLGGPDFLFLDDGRVLSCSRCHHIGNWCTTSLYLSNADGTGFHQVMVLPSGGDTSYAGMLIDGKNLLVSYYAGHETHWPSIYLAKIPLECLK